MQDKTLPGVKKEYLGMVDITNEQYHSSAGISRSGIVEFRDCPKKYWHRYLNPNYKPKESTKEMIFGTAFHSLILEPAKFETDYFKFEKIDRRTSAGKEAYQDMLNRSAGKLILDSDDLDTLEGMKQSLMADAEAKELITGAYYEKSIYWVDEDTGLLCKCRPDILHNGFVVDLKTTKSAAFRSFNYDFYDSGYHIQLAMISLGLASLGIDMRNFLDLAVEKIAPFCHAIFPIDDEVIDYGIQEFKYNLISIKQCMEKNIWPSYPTTNISLPRWAKREE